MAAARSIQTPLRARLASLLPRRTDLVDRLPRIERLHDDPERIALVLADTEILVVPAIEILQLPRLPRPPPQPRPSRIHELTHGVLADASTVDRDDLGMRRNDGVFLEFPVDDRLFVLFLDTLLMEDRASTLLLSPSVPAVG